MGRAYTFKIRCVFVNQCIKDRNKAMSPSEREVKFHVDTCRSRHLAQEI